MKLRRVVIILTLIVTRLPAFAQSTPPFRQMLQEATVDSQKLNVYRKIHAYFKTTNSDSLKYYLEDGIKAFTTDGYTKGRAALLGMASMNYSDQGDAVAAQKAAEESLALYQGLNDELGIAKIHNSLGVLEGKKGNYEAAVRHFINALSYFEHTNDTANIVNTYIKIGTANNLAGNDSKGIEYFEKGLALSLLIPVTPNRAYLYNNLGSYYGKNHNFVKAEAYLLKALQISSRPDFVQVRIPSLMNMGNLYAEQNQTAKAMEYYKEALKLAKATGQKEEEAKLMHSIGMQEGIANNGNLASLLDALARARKMGNREMEANIILDMARVADTMRNYEDEVVYLKRATEIKDSLRSIAKATEIASLQSVHELGRSNTQLAALQVAERRNAEKKNLIIIIAIILAVTLATLLVFFIRGRRLNNALARREKELQKANDIKDRLFSIVGHDLRGPIGNIPVLLSIYNNPETQEDEKRFILDSLEENSVASMETLEKLLNWGKLQIKGVTLNQAVFNVAEILDNKLRLFKVSASNKNITILNKVPAQTQLYADENHFKFIVRNLLANAIKYTRTGGTIELNAEMQDNDKYVVFSVRDNGIGIDKERQQHIFEPYNDSTVGTANEIGNSIGLMLCKEFAEQNGGDIWVKSEKGQGTTFYFTVLGYKPTNN